MYYFFKISPIYLINELISKGTSSFITLSIDDVLYITVNVTNTIMENTYTKKENELVKAKPETIQFLLNYSKSLKITEVNNHKFESNLN